MPLDPSRVKALFQAAIDLADPADRPAFLDRECGEDQELRRRMEELLAAHDRPARALERPLAVEREPAPSTDNETVATAPPPTGEASTGVGPDPGPTETLSPEQAVSLIGTVIAGRYKLRQEIGEGGMGSVYLAEQTQPVRRQVAIKLIKPGMDSRTVLARFESERQALALMEHPNIARVLDAGTTDNGRPFFVMELVKGIPLTDYCDQRRLGLTERLELFRHICSAVHHAHQKGIIHRDIKPSNILVESHDGCPVPKVIDFGLAKAISGLQLSDLSLFTAFGSVAGTPLYMAPEQASFNALDVDTRADIYALGVVLYELLTGSTPIRRETFRQAALEEALRLIREAEPPTPSSRISTSESLPSLAATRQAEPSRLSRFVRGDLDWIVMKALAKDRQRRYESAIALAQDIERFTNHEPVSAGPPTTAYRLRKFARKYRTPLATAAAFALLLVAAAIVSTWLAIAATRARGQALAEAEKARAVNAFLTQDLLSQAEPAHNAVEDKVTLLEVLDRAAVKVGKRFAGQPELERELRLTIAGAYHGLASWDKAEAQYRALLASARHDADSAGTYQAISELAHIFRRRGQVGGEALAMAKTAAEGLERLLGPDHPDTLISMNNLAQAYLAARRPDEALSLSKATLRLSRAKLGLDHPDTLISMNNLAQAYLAGLRLDEALRLFEETLRLSRAKLGLDHPDTLANMNNLAGCYMTAGKLDQALPLFEKSLRLSRARLGPGHPDTLANMDNLAACYQRMHRLDRSIPLIEETLGLREKKLGRTHPDTLRTVFYLGVNYKHAGRLAAALLLLEEVYQASQTIPAHRIFADRPLVEQGIGQGVLLIIPARRIFADQLLDGYVKAGKAKEAAAVAGEIVAEARKSLTDSVPLAGMLAQNASALLQARAFTAAEPLLRECLALREKVEADDWTTFNTKSMLGGALLGQERYAEAEPLLRVGYEGMKQRADRIPPPAKVRLVKALDRLIALAEATNQPDDAKRRRGEKAKLAGAATPKPGAEKR